MLGIKGVVVPPMPTARYANALSGLSPTNKEHESNSDAVWHYDLADFPIKPGSVH